MPEIVSYPVLPASMILSVRKSLDTLVIPFIIVSEADPPSVIVPPAVLFPAIDTSPVVNDDPIAILPRTTFGPIASAVVPLLYLLLILFLLF